jgi:toxin-antitoxin system PIN domain toxin
VTRPALLDVNVLIALFDAGHVHHEAAHDWFADNRTHGWATCAITENGFVRVLTNPASSVRERAPAILGSLRTFCASGHHVFWPDLVSLREAMFKLSLAHGHRQLTDIYLLGLATKMGGRLATFDRTIPVSSVRGARPETLAVISQDAG